MRAIVDRRDFAKALKVVLPAVPKTGGFVVLQGVKITCGESGFDLCCTSLDLTIATVVDVGNTTPGEVIVEATRLSRIVDKMAGDHITIDDADGTVTVTSGETVATLRCLPVADWPKIPEPDGELVTLDVETVELVGRILPMASVDKNRPAITGVYIGGGQAAACDGYRLAVVDGLPELGPAIVPASALATVVDRDETVQVTIDARHAHFAAGPTTWTVRLIEGDYPNFPKLVRADEPYTLTVGRWALGDAVTRLRALGAEETNGVILARDGDKLTVSVSDSEIGSLADVVSCGGTWADRLRLNLNYLGQLLAALDGDEVHLNVADGLKPVQARTGRMLQLLMPMKVTG